MKAYKTMAHINSLNGELAEITVLEKVGDNDYILSLLFCRFYFISSTAPPASLDLSAAKPMR